MLTMSARAAMLYLARVINPKEKETVGIDGEASSARMPRWPSLDVLYEQSETVYIDARANFQSLWGAGAGAGVGVGVGAGDDGAGDDGACGEDGCPCCF